MSPRAGLNRDILIAAALDVVDRDGLDALSMRRLGAELGVDPMAAYRHIPNKDALLDGIVEAVVSQADLTDDPALSWQERLGRLVRAYVEALMAHPNALPVIAERPWRTPGALRVLERALDVMTKAGASPHDALVAINAVGFFTSGLALAIAAQNRAPGVAEQHADTLSSLPAEQYPAIHELLRSGQTTSGPDDIVEFAVTAVVAEVERRIGS
ncbi:MAG: hypothetical protein Kow0067_15430 [Coriobacteriia bacterium]